MVTRSTLFVLVSNDASASVDSVETSVYSLKIVLSAVQWFWQARLSLCRYQMHGLSNARQTPRDRNSLSLSHSLPFCVFINISSYAAIRSTNEFLNTDSASETVASLVSRYIIHVFRWSFVSCGAVASPGPLIKQIIKGLYRSESGRSRSESVLRSFTRKIRDNVDGMSVPHAFN